MSLRFDEAKATQTAALILSLRGGQMHYLKLIKLLYLVDRAALLRWGIPVTTDRYASMDDGPVVSNIYNLIVKKDVPKRVWSRLISPPIGDYEVRLLTEGTPPNDRLSPAEERLIREIFNEYGHKNRWDLRDYVMHKLPEWKDPHGSSFPIRIGAILKAGGEDDNEIRAILRELRLMAASDEVLPSV
jgi:uncharacterized phage-associated protein